MNRSLAISILSAVATAASASAATLVTTGETIDMSGTTQSIVPSSFGNLNQITHNGGGSFTIDSTGPNNDFYISYADNNVDSDLFKYLQIDFAAGMAVTSAVSFQVYLANTNFFAGTDLAANVSVTPSTEAFSILFDLSGWPSWNGVKNGVRLDPFNGPAYREETFTITGITFGDTLVPEPSAALLSGIAGLGLLLRRRRD